MRYGEYDPGSRLAPFVRCFWILESDATPGEHAVEPILPDGCMELVVHYGDRFRRHDADGGSSWQPRTFLIGQLRTALTVQPTGRIGVLGVRFRPGGAHALLGRLPANEIEASTIPVRELLAEVGDELEERVAAAVGDAGRIAVAEAFLARHVFVEPRVPDAVDAAVALLEARDGRLAMAALSSAVGVGERTLQRRFQTRVGFGPKQLARILRFQEAVRQLEAGAHGRQAEIAIRCGYCDQAHMIREFKRFAGRPPSAFRATPTALADLLAGVSETSNPVSDSIR